MAINTYTKDGRTFYMVVSKIRIEGKQICRRKKNITSLQAAKRCEIELSLELMNLKNNVKIFNLSTWYKYCIDQMKLEFRKSTICGYDSSFNKWILPKIGNLLLKDITPSLIHDLIHSQDNFQSPYSRKNCLKQLKKIFQLAIDNGHLSHNPCKGIRVKIPESIKFVLNKSEIETLLNEGKKFNHPFYNHWVLALLTGMRSGELYALKWTDVDFDNEYITVNKSWSRVNGFGPTKNYSNRVVPISNTLALFLKELKLQKNIKEEFVLPRLASWDIGLQAQELKKFCLLIGITPVKFHDLRATFITQLLLKGVAVAKVMAIVGHTELKTTMVYLRLVGSDLKGATDELNINLPELHRDNVVNLF